MHSVGRTSVDRTAADALEGIPNTAGFDTSVTPVPPDLTGKASASSQRERLDARKSYELLTRLTADVRAIRAADGRHYAVVPLEGRPEFYRLGSGEFRRLLLRFHHQATGHVPQRSAVADVVAMLRGRAEMTNEAEPVFLRIAPDDTSSAYLLDLGDPERRTVRITASGWEIVEQSNVAFWRPPSQVALPAPVHGGSLDQLKKYVNVTAAQWPLFVVWLTAAIRPVGPYPLLVLTGEQGSGKTTLAELCRLMIDPHESLPRGLPKSERDLMVAAHNSWLQIYDNTSTISNWQSDALCRLATGGGFAARSLFTDDREMIINAERPMILNGIDNFVRRGDLMDRSIFLQLRVISPARRLGRMAFWAEFRREHSQFLGALYSAVSGGIRHWPEVRLPKLSRMADLDLWGEAVVRGLGWPPGSFVERLSGQPPRSLRRGTRRSAAGGGLDRRTQSPSGPALLRHRAAPNTHAIQAPTRDYGRRLAQFVLGTFSHPSPHGGPAPRDRDQLHDGFRAHAANHLDHTPGPRETEPVGSTAIARHLRQTRPSPLSAAVDDRPD